MSRQFRTSTIPRRRSILHDEVAFPILDAHEITQVLQTCNLDVLEEMVARPNHQFMKYLVESLLDMFTSTSLGTIDRRIEAIGAGVENKEGETEVDDTTQSLGLVMLVRKAGEFFNACGFYDFCMVDMVRPDPYRTRRMLSSVINFIKFRDTKVGNVEQYINEALLEDEKLELIKKDTTELANKIDSLREKLEQGQNQSSLQEIGVYNAKIENELRKLKRIQEDLTAEHSQYKQEKAGLIKNLEDINYVMYNQTNQLETLKSYDQVDLESLNALIEQFQSEYDQTVDKLTELESNNRNITITIDSLERVETDLKNLFRILEEVLHDLEKYDQVNDTLNRLQETLEQANFESNDLTRQIQQVKRQLVNLEDKTTKIKQQSEEKSVKSQEILDRLKHEYDEAIVQRNEKERELQGLRDQIGEIQNEMKIRRNELENEVKSSEMAVARLNSHLKVYLTEMNKKMEET